MPKLAGVNHLRAVRALEKAGFKVVNQGRHIVMSDGTRILTIPRHNPVNEYTMGGIVRDAGLTKDIEFFEASDQRIIVAGIIAHLKTGAETETRRKKQLRPNPFAPWELRLDRFRVFYSIEKGAKLKVVAVGHKEHSHLFIQGKKVQL